MRGGRPSKRILQCDYSFCHCVPGRPRHAKRLGSELEPVRALRVRAGFLESSPRIVFNVPRWAPKSALYPTRCHRTLRASDPFALSESMGRAQLSTPRPRTQRARAIPRSEERELVVAVLLYYYQTAVAHLSSGRRPRRSAPAGFDRLSAGLRGLST